MTSILAVLLQHEPTTLHPRTQDNQQTTPPSSPGAIRQTIQSAFIPALWQVHRRLWLDSDLQHAKQSRQLTTSPTRQTPLKQSSWNSSSSKRTPEALHWNVELRKRLEHLWKQYMQSFFILSSEEKKKKSTPLSYFTIAFLGQFCAPKMRKTMLYRPVQWILVSKMNVKNQRCNMVKFSHQLGNFSQRCDDS